MSNQTYMHRHHKPLERFNINNLIIEEEGDNQINQYPTKGLRMNYDITERERVEILKLFGNYKRVIKYNEFFFNSHLDSSLYLKAAKVIAEGKIGLEELISFQLESSKENFEYAPINEKRLIRSGFSINDLLIQN